VGLLVDKLAIKNQTKIRSYKERVPDTWIYIQERDVKIGRLQIFNNWSPYMVKDYENTEWIGLEYFCTEGDKLWQMSDADFIQMATQELEHIGVIEKGAVKDAVRIKVQKAYPAYFGSYYELDKVRNFLDRIENLYCVGRNGQHRYNNMDHSMLTAMNVVDAIKAGSKDKSAIWNVNTEEEYHESK
jgi:protoporphyrinogen oxidase